MPLADKKLNLRIRSALRKIWLWSAARREVEKKARIGKIKDRTYRCSECMEIKHRDKEKLNIDHITPIGTLISWDVYVERLFCGPEGLRAVCKTCHDRKTFNKQGSSKRE